MLFELYDNKNYVDEKGKRHNLSYCILIGPEGYGMKVTQDGRETREIRDITTSLARAREIVSCLSRNLVTPVSLRDVIEDLL